ncbi:MAG TPA: pitrilysin family protein [Spirochaetota bacterium]|nr:pitrilysin family protein [Spirochaetota bacterium]
MKNFLIKVSVFVLVFSTAIVYGAAKYSLRDLPVVKRSTLTNGVRILSVEDDLPRSEITCSIGFGKIYEDSNNAGISEVLARAITIAGTKNYPGNELNSVLENLGGAISVTAGWENITITVRVLSKHSDLAFHIIADILKNLKLDDESVQYSKDLVFQKFMREMDDPANLGFTKAREIIFDGKGYGALMTKSSIDSMNSEVLKKLWDDITTSENIILAISSPIAESHLKEMINKNFGDIKAGSGKQYYVDNEKLKKNLAARSGKIYFIPKESQQATIVLGTIAPDVNYKGNYSLTLLNYILGGGSFSSRLMTEIRVKRGLAYSVFSIIRNRSKTGVFLSFVQTRNDEAAISLQLMRENILKLKDEPVSDEELLWAKESITNSYIFNFATVSDVLSNYIELEINNWPGDYFYKYLDKIDEVNKKDILQEAKLLFGSGLIIVVVGDKTLEQRLRKEGEVVVLN